MNNAQPLPFDLLKLLVTMGIIFLVILVAGVLVALGTAIWFICTAPFALLADMALRIFLLSIVGVVVWQAVQVVRPFFRR